MRIELFILDPEKYRPVPVGDWMKRGRAAAITATWIVIKTDVLPPFTISKDDLYDRCKTFDFFESARTATYSGSRLGTEAEWACVHEAKMRYGLDNILAAMDGNVVASKPAWTESGTVVRSFTSEGKMRCGGRGDYPENEEIFARRFKSIVM